MDWITESDRMVTETYFLEASPERLGSVLALMRSSARDFELDPTWQDRVRPESITSDEVASLLESGELASCNVRLTTAEPGFEFRVLFVFGWVDGSKVDVDASWWADDVFGEDGDDEARFRDLMRYFLTLHEALGSRRLLVGPENTQDPRDPTSPWIDV
jgi:hypothetical protein